MTAFHPIRPIELGSHLSDIDPLVPIPRSAADWNLARSKLELLPRRTART